MARSEVLLLPEEERQLALAMLKTVEQELQYKLTKHYNQGTRTRSATTDEAQSWLKRLDETHNAREVLQRDQVFIRLLSSSSIAVPAAGRVAPSSAGATSQASSALIGASGWVATARNVTVEVTGSNFSSSRLMLINSRVVHRGRKPRSSTGQQMSLPSSEDIHSSPIPSPSLNRPYSANNARGAYYRRHIYSSAQPINQSHINTPRPAGGQAYSPTRPIPSPLIVPSYNFHGSPYMTNHSSNTGTTIARRRNFAPQANTRAAYDMEISDGTIHIIGEADGLRAQSDTGSVALLPAGGGAGSEAAVGGLVSRRSDFGPQQDVLGMLGAGGGGGGEYRHRTVSESGRMEFDASGVASGPTGSAPVLQRRVRELRERLRVADERLEMIAHRQGPLPVTPVPASPPSPLSPHGGSPSGNGSPFGSARERRVSAPGSLSQPRLGSSPGTTLRRPYVDSSQVSYQDAVETARRVSESNERWGTSEQVPRFSLGSIGTVDVHPVAETNGSDAQLASHTDEILLSDDVDRAGGNTETGLRETEQGTRAGEVEHERGDDYNNNNNNTERQPPPLDASSPIPVLRQAWIPDEASGEFRTREVNRQVGHLSRGLNSIALCPSNNISDESSSTADSSEGESSSSSSEPSNSARGSARGRGGGALRQPESPTTPLAVHGGSNETMHSTGTRKSKGKGKAKSGAGGQRETAAATAAAAAASQRHVLEKTLVSFVCPITRMLLKDPVIAEDGFTYERSAIAQWFQKSNRSPITNLPVAHTGLVPNLGLRGAIDEWQQARGY
mmetsp:Transcript_19386/g.23166  ORF Transcript_19386/g.23166 Transcript_19386/m.23166 type:complete len:787 (-) Transcript_19386:598-2958(-)|eukprot:CAMPEP_0197852184 /NCGR_PEP_ID=MMETSP1438-20131217/19852_1 /TAXON_ID=1461541 /ORGANISM="Pterosperma sp., Strain CCMP1384" /LENGTH=786 /DNA_ID=CAMNT_0043466085 /DNA_START=362 /DNA_END=2725 /DNA_ORIENTATION=-